MAIASTSAKAIDDPIGTEVNPIGITQVEASQITENVAMKA
jgi:hypothetical protein